MKDGHSTFIFVLYSLLHSLRVERGMVHRLKTVSVVLYSARPEPICYCENKKKSPKWQIMHCYNVCIMSVYSYMPVNRIPHNDNTSAYFYRHLLYLKSFKNNYFYPMYMMA